MQGTTDSLRPKLGLDGMKRRNTFNMISIGERAGSGVPDIYSVWAEKDWEQPKVEEQFGPDRTILELSFRKKQTIKTNDKNKR